MKTEGQKMEVRATSSGLDSPVRTKVAIVTGASRGIGHGIAERLLEKGYCVVANSRNITLAETWRRYQKSRCSEQGMDSAIRNFGRIATRLVREIGPMSELAPEFPLAAHFSAPLRVASEAKGATGFTPMWSGQSFRLARELSAKEIHPRPCLGNADDTECPLTFPGA